MRILLLTAVLAAAPVQRAASDPADAARQGYGLAVAVSDGLVFVGEPANTMRPGVVYVYAREDGAWSEVDRLHALDSTVGDGFGTAVAAAQGTLLVSSSQAGGTVHVFTRDDDGTWIRGERLYGDEGEGFGASIAFDGRSAVVGAPGAEKGAGRAYVFVREGTSWIEEAVLVSGEPAEGEGFGATAAVSGAHLLVGAPNSRSRSGAVYAWMHDGAAWQFEGGLPTRDGGTGSRFGAALAIVGDRVSVGAPMRDGSVGAVVNYSWDPESGWSEAGELRPFAPTRGLRFGSSVAVGKGETWVGAPGANGWSGVYYVFTRGVDGSWAGAVVQRSEAAARGGGFGGAVALGEGIVATGLPGVDGNSGAVVVFEPGPDGGVWIQSARLQGPMEGLDAATGAEILCEDGKAGGFECLGIDLLSFLPIREIGGGRATEMNDIWGWTDPDTGREYAIAGRTDGTSFVDVTDPVNPVYVGDLPMTRGSRSSFWRDMKVYRDHVFVVADGAGKHGMQVMDLTRLRSFAGTPMVFAADTTYHRIASAHNIVINTDTGFAYTVGNAQGGETCGGGLHMIDIREPTEPSFAGCFSHPGTGRSGTGYTHDAQCVLYHGPDEEHRGREICFGSAETALAIADVTDREHPVALAAAAYPNLSYAHQGWITDDHRHFYMNDELDEASGKSATTRTLIWDVTDLDDPQLLKEHFSTSKASDHNLYIRGTLMYQSNYLAGLRVFDISNPANPVEVAFFDTTPFSRDEAGFEGSWSNFPYFESGTIVVSSIKEGLFVLRRQKIDL